MSQPLKILSVVGARPNLPKISPLLREMRRYSEIESVLVHTGQHYDEALSEVFFRQMGIPEPDFNLGVGSGSHAAQTAEVLKRIEPVLLDQRPDLVVVVGDVNSTLAVSLAAAKLGIRIAHVEAGLRSFDRSMPEEINRILTDTLADYLFVTEEAAVDHLLAEGRPRSSIHFVGNVMIDSLRYFLSAARKSPVGRDLGLLLGDRWQRFAVLTLHRPSNVDSSDKLVELLAAIETIATEIPVIFPVHPRTRQRLDLADLKRVRLIDPLGYFDFLCLLSNATMVLTDSGGVQEETTALGVPCLTLRDNTERPVTISEGTNILVGTEPDEILAAARGILAGRTKRGCVPRLWDGRAAARIVEVLLNTAPRREAVATLASGDHISFVRGSGMTE
jgi:UDP-N-acetylglucosamine 2-epimerase (non-hydrolysing)